MFVSDILTRTERVCVCRSVSRTLTHIVSINPQHIVQSRMKVGLPRQTLVYFWCRDSSLYFFHTSIALEPFPYYQSVAHTCASLGGLLLSDWHRTSIWKWCHRENPGKQFFFLLRNVSSSFKSAVLPFLTRLKDSGKIHDRDPNEWPRRHATARDFWIVIRIPFILKWALSSKLDE